MIQNIGNSLFHPYAKEIIPCVVLNSLVHQPLIGGTLKNSTSHSPCRIAMSDNTT